MTDTTTYTLSPAIRLLSHRRRPVSLLRDGFFHEEDRQIFKAHIRSGDYFALLATQLDEISDNLTAHNEPESVILQHLADNLLYLQKHYSLVKKKDPLD